MGRWKKWTIILCFLLTWYVGMFLFTLKETLLTKGSSLVALIQRPIIKEQKEKKKIKRITVMHLGKNKSPEISESIMASFGGALLYIWVLSVNTFPHTFQLAKNVLVYSSCSSSLSYSLFTLKSNQA